MSTEIRQIEPTDFEQIFDLFKRRKSRSLLGWIYGHPCAEGRSGYVAVQDGRIIGAVGFVRSTYVVNGKKLTGLIPLSWEVEEESRGITGIRLLRRALSDADFFMGMDGSEDMKAIFKGLNFKKIGEGKNVRKVIRPIAYLKTLRKIGIRDLLRMVLHVWNNATSVTPVSRVQLIETTANYSTGSIGDVIPGLFYNTISQGHVQWLTSNPGMTAIVFEVRIENTVYAPIHCFIRYLQNGYRRGQITHIPPLKTEHRSYYKDIVLAVEDYFMKNEATSISTLVTNPDLESAFRDQKYAFDPKIRPIVIKTDEETEKLFEGATIHLSYAESDKSVRNI